MRASFKGGREGGESNAKSLAPRPSLGFFFQAKPEKLEPFFFFFFASLHPYWDGAQAVDWTQESEDEKV